MSAHGETSWRGPGTCWKERERKGWGGEEGRELLIPQLPSSSHCGPSHCMTVPKPELPSQPLTHRNQDSLENNVCHHSLPLSFV